MQKAKNDNELWMMLIAPIQRAIDGIVKQMLLKNSELIQQIVYDVYDPIEYERTGQFKEAWSMDDAKRLRTDYVEGGMYYDSRLLDVNPDMGQHASVIDGQPMTEYLADVIYQGLSGTFGRGRARYASGSSYFKGQAWTKKRDVWTKLMNSYKAAEFKKLFKEELEKNGCAVKTYGTQIKITDYYR